MKEKKFSMDRRKSGEVSFNENFPMLTWTAIEGDKDEMKLLPYVVYRFKCRRLSGDGGRFAMTNQYFLRNLTIISASTAKAVPIK